MPSYLRGITGRALEVWDRWALRGQGGGLTLNEIAMKIAGNRGRRYPETKIQNVLDVLSKAGQVEKSEATAWVLPLDRNHPLE